jgi:peptidoglycan/xylan/chitin deacetylase (PgdA/CDA1 family)
MKRFVSNSLVFLLFVVGSAIASIGQGIPILVYRRFDPAKPGPTTVRTSVFEAQLAWLEDHHYRLLPLHAAIDELRSHSDASVPAVVLTVDDGHRSVYTEMFPLIVKHHVSVTLFIYPSAISNASYALTWDQIKKMQASGLVDVESHTYWHPNFRRERARLSPVDYAAFVKLQMERSRQALESRLGIKVDELAWPYGIYDRELEEAARRAGYTTAFAFDGGLASSGCDPYAIPRIPVSDSDRGARFAQLLAHPRPRGRIE